MKEETPQPCSLLTLWLPSMPSCWTNLTEAEGKGDQGPQMLASLDAEKSRKGCNELNVCAPTDVLKS